MLDCFLTENGLKWENCIGVCSDGAQTMAGMRKGLQALIKKASPTSYLCETGFSAVATLKTKYRSQLNFEQELRVAVSCFKPRFEKLCTAKRAHCSH